MNDFSCLSRKLLENFVLKVAVKEASKWFQTQLCHAS